MTDTPVPSWITEGVQVAAYNSGYGRPDQATVTIVTIEKIGKVHITTADGRKWRVSNLTAVGESTRSWTGPTKLCPLDDVDVRAVLRRYRARAAYRPLAEVIDRNHPIHGGDPKRLLAAATAIRDAANAAIEALTEG